jgi:hypothetical protein
MNGKMKGIPRNSLAFVTQNDLKLPQLITNELEVFNLETETLNVYLLKFFIGNRMKKLNTVNDYRQIDGVIRLTSLDLLNNTVMSSINGVGIDDAVYDFGSVARNHRSQVDHRQHQSRWVVDDCQNYVSNFMELPAVELKQWWNSTARNSVNGNRVIELLSRQSSPISQMAKIQQQIKDLNDDKRLKA